MRIRSVCLALVLFTAIVGWSASAHSHEDLLETWEGEIDLGGQGLEIVVRITEDD